MQIHSIVLCYLSGKVSFEFGTHHCGGMWVTFTGRSGLAFASSSKSTMSWCSWFTAKWRTVSPNWVYSHVHRAVGGVVYSCVNCYMCYIIFMPLYEMSHAGEQVLCACINTTLCYTFLVSVEDVTMCWLLARAFSRAHTEIPYIKPWKRY